MSTSEVYPLYVHELTGKAGDELSLDAMTQVRPDLPDAAARELSQTHLASDATVNAGNLMDTGWGVLFAADLDPQVKAQLKPLLDWRRSKIPKPGKPGKVDLYQEFTVPAGVTANSWTVGQGVTLTGAVRPWKGVPYYLMIVGSPASISFEFQALLKMQWAVGRVYFENIEDYGRYAAAVVAYETAAELEQTKTVAVWLTCNPGDPATTRLSSVMQADFGDDDHKLGEGSQFEMEAFVGERAATKAQLAEMMRGNLASGRPSVLFTGSHGLKCGMDDAVRQLARQGALVTQEFDPRAPSDPSNWVFTGEDVPADARLDGTMAFLFACYSCGCPQNDTYNVQADGTPIQIATGDMIAKLPQVLLSRGTLAVFGHVDEAFTYSFGGLNGANGPQQPQVIRNPLERLMQGQPAGWAADALTASWTNYSVLCNEAKPTAAGGTAAAPDLMQYGKLGIARDDARNYILLGDPAVRLRVDKLKEPN